MKKAVSALLVSSLLFSGCAMIPTGDVTQGVHFMKKDMSGATKDQVLAEVQKYAKSMPKNIVLMGRNGEKLEVPLKDLGIGINVDDTVEAIRQYGYEPNFLEMVQHRLASFSSTYVVEPKIDVKENTFQAFFKNYMAEHVSAGAHGTLSVVEGKIVYTPPTGIEVIDEAAMRKAILEAIQSQKNASVTIVFKKAGEETEQMRQMKAMDTVLATYTTQFNSGVAGRSRNIELAANKVTGTLLMPGEVFSYNAVVGERTSEEGYEMAPVYINGKLEPGIGGGICQVSSTLFAASLYAGMDIVDRTTHFEPVSYIPLGMDATVAYGYLDYAFRNALTKAVYVLAQVHGDSLTVSILGSKVDSFVSAEVNEISRSYHPHGEVKKLLEAGEEEGTVAGHNGITTVHQRKLVRADGTSRVDSYDSYYEPVDTVIIQSQATIKALEAKKAAEKAAKEKAGLVKGSTAKTTEPPKVQPVEESKQAEMQKKLDAVNKIETSKP